jgi:nucleotide-binding universal stress UspA family protein
MSVFRRILYATDFSSASRPALARAIALARQNRAALWVAHALLPLVVPDGGCSAQLAASVRISS